MASEFKAVFGNKKWSDDFYQFLQFIFHLYPEGKFHNLLATVSREKGTDEEIYKTVQQKLPGIKPFLSELTLALPSLKKQKKEMATQVLQLLNGRLTVNGYLEIGSTGRYISELRKHISLSGPLWLTNDIAPSNAIGGIFERGQIRKLGVFIPLNNYLPLPPQVADVSLDLVTCHIGLHHCPPELLPGYINSIKRVLRPGGMFIIRDHNVTTPEMGIFISVVHTVFNLGLNVTWEVDSSEFKSFKSADEWGRLLAGYGFTDSGGRILQDNDPTDNTLMLFTKN